MLKGVFPSYTLNPPEVHCKTQRFWSLIFISIKAEQPQEKQEIGAPLSKEETANPTQATPLKDKVSQWDFFSAFSFFPVAVTGTLFKEGL